MMAESVKLKCLGGMDAKFVTVTNKDSNENLRFCGVAGFFRRSEMRGRILSIRKYEYEFLDGLNPVARMDLQGAQGLVDAAIPIFLVAVQTNKGENIKLKVRCTPENLKVMNSFINK